MELANIFLETDEGKVKLVFARDLRHKTHRDVMYAAEYFMDILDEYISVAGSSFYMAIRDDDMFYFYCDHGSISPVHDFFVFDRMFLASSDQAGPVRGVAFVITDQFPIVVRPRRKFLVYVYSDNTRFYAH